ncbi:MAG: EVE domain-containing protein [Alphaproteobacteria bacterium]|nr:EVE domain-containing protein [Alphaproteobacteria bacterium]
MAYWLMKSEPDAYPWEKLVKDGKGNWDGVRNYQAANNMKAMKKGDLAFFYHSNIGMEIVGIMEITKEAHPDPSDEKNRFVMVSVKPVKALKKFVTLKDIKADKILNEMALVKQSRLSVSPVTEIEWNRILELAR